MSHLQRSNTFTCISLFGNIDKTSLFVRYFIEIIDNLSESTFTHSKKPMCKRVGKSEGAKQGYIQGVPELTSDCDL